MLTGLNAMMTGAFGSANFRGHSLSTEHIE